MAYAVSECNHSGQLAKSYCIIQKLIFLSATSTEKRILLVCSCENSLQQKQRLTATGKYITESLDHFCVRERSEYMSNFYQWQFVCIIIQPLTCILNRFEKYKLLYAYLWTGKLMGKSFGKLRIFARKRLSKAEIMKKVWQNIFM